MRFAWLFSGFIVVACSSGGDGPCTLTAVGASCLNDTDCCTGWCQLEDNGAYCQAKPKPLPTSCVGPAAFCTQDRNCCSGLCQNGTCFAGGGGTACLSIGSTCSQDDSCCSVNCYPNGKGGMACAPQPQADGGLTCGLPGAPCASPGLEDPAECCFGICGTNGQCAGGTGGGGSNCGGTGAYCKYGTDCCSGQCQQVSNGSQCH
jgi:hypothetical protein